MKPDGRVFVVDDDELIVSALARALKSQSYQVRTASSARGLVGKISAWSPHVVLLDITLPDGNGLQVLEEIHARGIDTQVVMLTGDDTAGTAIQAMKSGAADYVTKPFDLEEVRLIVGNLAEKQRLKREVEFRRSLDAERAGGAIIGRSEKMMRLREDIEKISSAGVDTILVTGESGTGKEVVARYLHRLMHESDAADYAPFIGVNCTALPATLIESELFGHEKGAFTDAKTDKRGVFERAERGTILLDEIGDMPLNLQGKLLRVLEERIVRRVGGDEDIAVDATVLATTNRNLLETVEQGGFRTDLFYRLNAFALSVPPLRDRGRDIIELSHHFFSHFSKKYNKKQPQEMSSGCEEALMSYDWPGNVRELKNVIERLVVLESAEVIEVEHLPKEIGTQGAAEVGTSEHLLVLPQGGLSLEEVKRDLIEQALNNARHNKVQAAKLLKISYDTLRYQMKRFGLA
jgi:DNA-binding NtrC family response regulator